MGGLAFLVNQPAPVALARNREGERAAWQVVELRAEVLQDAVDELSALSYKLTEKVYETLGSSSSE